MKTHGNASTYEAGCRCDDCRGAHRVKQRRMRALRIVRGLLDPTLIPHGTRTGYSGWGCKCEACSEAEMTYHRNRKAPA